MNQNNYLTETMKAQSEWSRRHLEIHFLRDGKALIMGVVAIENRLAHKFNRYDQ